MKLVDDSEILNENQKEIAKEFDYWPDGVEKIIRPHISVGGIEFVGLTRAQWEEERARIAANEQATQEAREIALTGSMTSEEPELAEIARGKRSKEDQELWDKVAMGSLQTYLNLCELSGARENFVGKAASMADAFMTERAKRMKG